MLETLFSDLAPRPITDPHQVHSFRENTLATFLVPPAGLVCLISALEYTHLESVLAGVVNKIDPMHIAP